MEKIALIKKALKEVVGVNPNYPIIGVVKAVDGELCWVELVSGLVVSDVKISATVTDSENYLLQIPKIGSDVLMLSGDGTLSNLYLIKVDQVAQFKFSQDGMKIEFDSVDKKVKIENDTVNLKELFTDLATIISGLKVSVISVGAPSGTPLPDTIALVNQFSTKINNLLK